MHGQMYTYAEAAPDASAAPLIMERIIADG
jgi:hypothetical protein